MGFASGIAAVRDGGGCCVCVLLWFGNLSQRTRRLRMEWNGVVRIFEYELNIAFEHSSYFFSLFHRSLVLSLVLWFSFF